MGRRQLEAELGQCTLWALGIVKESARTWTAPQTPGALRRTVPVSTMALPGSPEPNTRTLPSAWTSLDGGNVMHEAQEALETYKKKDANKGA